MNTFLGSVGLVTLALGAIGIINIMLVAVADRTREIGLRKAVGATNASIMFQFFVEGAFLTLMSGGIGIAAGGAGGGVTGSGGSGSGFVSGAAGGDAATGGSAAEGVAGT
jgi:putative ABC transport system permease protein